jgi:hypothetical protein
MKSIVLALVEHSPRYRFKHVDNCDSERAADWPCVPGFADKVACGRRVGAGPDADGLEIVPCVLNYRSR